MNGVCLKLPQSKLYLSTHTIAKKRFLKEIVFKQKINEIIRSGF